MIGIVISRRDGVVKAPDGTQFRVHRGKTLAHAAHPVVMAYPNDWMPVTIDLAVNGPGDEDVRQDYKEDVTVLMAKLDELRNELAEVEDLAESRGAELARLADTLAARGVDLPDEDDREPGWLVDLVFAWMDRPLPGDAAAGADAEPDVTPHGPDEPAPRPPRKRVPSR
jgi:hypothetical protein